jgi:hypothetical protein
MPVPSVQQLRQRETTLRKLLADQNGSLGAVGRRETRKRLRRTQRKRRRMTVQQKRCAGEPQAAGSPAPPTPDTDQENK